VQSDINKEVRDHLAAEAKRADAAAADLAEERLRCQMLAAQVWTCNNL
jgi:hypothetical protein